jgi:hypothetical protein
VAAVADTVAEGGTPTWRFSLSVPTRGSRSTPRRCAARADRTCPADVDPDRFVEQTYEEVPEPSRPLHETAIQSATWSPGVVTADFTVPTLTDGLSEPDEKDTLS